MMNERESSRNRLDPKQAEPRQKGRCTMKLMRFPQSSSALAVVALTLLAAAPAFPAFDINECGAPCTAQHRACMEQAKDSPNDIDRQLCESARKECFAACDAAFTEAQKEEMERQRLEHEEKARLGIEEPHRSSEEREEEYDRQQERAAQEKQEREERAAREERERQEKAAREKQEQDTVNGIPIYQFK